MATGSSIAGLIGVFLYGLLLRQYQYRTLYCVHISLCIISQLFTIAFVFGYTEKLGVGNFCFLATHGLCFGALGFALGHMPFHVVLAKITPRGSEATMYALLVGAKNLATGMIAPLTGTFINDHFVGVNKKNMLGAGSKYVNLIYI